MEYHFSDDEGVEKAEEALVNNNKVEPRQWQGLKALPAKSLEPTPVKGIEVRSGKSVSENETGQNASNKLSLSLKNVTSLPKKFEGVVNKEFEDDTWNYSKEKNNDEIPRCWFCRQRFFWYWRHPVARIFFALLIMVLNFFIYAIDPVAESLRDVNLPIIGSMWQIVTRKWSGTTGYLALRLIICLISFIGGPLIGWWIIHRIVLKRWLKLSMFGWYDKRWLAQRKLDQNWEQEIDEYKGSWFSMTITTIFWGYLWISIYNAMVPDENGVDDWLGIDEYMFGQMAASLSWMGDSFTFFMILDSMLQEDDKYPNSWVARYEDLWVHSWNGWLRIVFVWVIFLIGSIVVVYKVWLTNDSQFETWRLDNDYTTNEAERAFIGALIFGLDLAIVTQDWDFPEFRNSEKIMITGFSVLKVTFPPKCMEDKLPNNWWFEINGKWMNYFPMVVVMGLDMAAFIALAWYEPGEFGQYVGPDQKIWSIYNATEADYLGEQFFITLSYDLLNYTIRAGQCIDFSQEYCVDSECNWFDRGEYCTYGDDIKLAASYEESVSLWWTCTPFVFFLGVLVLSLLFLKKYQKDSGYTSERERISSFNINNP